MLVVSSALVAFGGLLRTIWGSIASDEGRVRVGAMGRRFLGALSKRCQAAPQTAGLVQHYCRLRISVPKKKHFAIII